MLVVVPFPLHQEGSAAARCILGLMRGFALHGVHARALTVNAPAGHTTSPPADVPAETAQVDYPGRWRGRWDRLLAPYSAFARGDFARRLTELSTDVDVVHIHGIGSGPLLPLSRAPAVAQIDCVTRRDRDLGAPWTREGRIALETWRAERRSCRRARWILASSREVAADFARVAPHACVHHAPLSLDPKYYPTRADLSQQTAGLIGTARWPPTANAVRRLLTRVWPLVLERNPGAQLVLAGNGMEPSAFPDLSSPPGVQWLGRVESAEAFLQSLGVLLYPLDRGSGAKVKVLESMLLGVPVVTTPPGAEGISGMGGLVVETEDAALAEATCALLESQEARRHAAEAAYRRFVGHHAPREAAVPVLELYSRMIG